VSGVVVRGVDPDRVNAVINIQSFLRQGTLAGLTAQHPLQVEDRTVSLPGIILGERLANQLGVFPGSPVQVVSPLGSPTAIGMIPKVRRFMVAGILRTGMSEIDQTLVFMGLSEAQKFFELPQRHYQHRDACEGSRSIAPDRRSNPTSSGVSLFCRRLDAAVAQFILCAATGKDRLFLGFVY
jgi:ABC-type lipoprotein release transport system permease subunit